MRCSKRHLRLRSATTDATTKPTEACAQGSVAPWCSVPAPALRPSVATTSSNWKWRAQLCACYLKPPQVGSLCKLSLCLWSPLRYKQHASALSPKGAAFPPSDLGDKTTAAEHNNLPPSPSFPCPDTYLKPSSHRLIFLYFLPPPHILVLTAPALCLYDNPKNPLTLCLVLKPDSCLFLVQPRNNLPLRAAHIGQNQLQCSNARWQKQVLFIV